MTENADKELGAFREGAQVLLKGESTPRTIKHVDREEKKLTVVSIDDSGNTQLIKARFEDVTLSSKSSAEEKLQVLSSQYKLDDFIRSGDQPKVHVAALHGWLESENEFELSDMNKGGYGWGQHLSFMIGNKMMPGDIVCVSGNFNAGCSDFVNQLVEGFAFNASESGSAMCSPLVTLLTTQSAEEITFNALSRWIGVDIGKFRGTIPYHLVEKTRRTSTATGKKEDLAFEIALSALGNQDVVIGEGDVFDHDLNQPPLIEQLVETNLVNKAFLGLEGVFSSSRQQIHLYKPHCTQNPLTFLDDVDKSITQQKEELESKNKDRQYLPILVIDPIKSFFGKWEQNETAYYRWMSHLKRLAKDGEWSAIIVSRSALCNIEPQNSFDSDLDLYHAAKQVEGFEAINEFCSSHICLVREPLQSEKTNETLVKAIVCKSCWKRNPYPCIWPRFKWDPVTGRHYSIPKKAVEKMLEKRQIELEKGVISNQEKAPVWNNDNSEETAPTETGLKDNEKKNWLNTLLTKQKPE